MGAKLDASFRAGARLALPGMSSELLLLAAQESLQIPLLVGSGFLAVSGNETIRFVFLKLRGG